MYHCIGRDAKPRLYPDFRYPQGSGRCNVWLFTGSAVCSRTDLYDLRCDEYQYPMIFQRQFLLQSDAAKYTGRPRDQWVYPRTRPLVKNREALLWCQDSKGSNGLLDQRYAPALQYQPQIRSNGPLSASPASVLLFADPWTDCDSIRVIAQKKIPQKCLLLVDVNSLAVWGKGSRQPSVYHARRSDCLRQRRVIL